MRLVFMGTPQFAVPTLEGLLSSSHELVAVFTQPDKPSGRGARVLASPVKHIARKHRVSVFQPDKLKGRPGFHWSKARCHCRCGLRKNTSGLVVQHARIWGYQSSCFAIA